MSDPTIKVTGRTLTFCHSFRKCNPQLFGGAEQFPPPPLPQHQPANLTIAAEPAPAPAQAKRIRQSAKPLLNKLESEYFEILKRDPHVASLRAQAKRYRLGNGIWYKPDFTGYAQAGRETAWEVKGPHAFRGGFENLKVAASAYPEIRWILVWERQRPMAGTGGITVTFTIDTQQIKREIRTRIKCAIRHDWQHHQDCFTGENGTTAVIAWKVCRRCAKSKLIHILT